MIVRHKVKDYATWRASFDAHADKRTASGLTNPRVYRSADDKNEVVILVDTSDTKRAREFAASADLKERMMKSGLADVPTIHILESA
jgi:hypothetical protein